MAFLNKPGAKDEFPPERFEPVIRCSICTGEQVAGFREKATGRFTDVMLIASSRDLDVFRRKYGVTQNIEKIY